jgi:hypothetical protein
MAYIVVMSDNPRDPNRPEQPRSEPEIILPGEGAGREHPRHYGEQPDAFIFVDRFGRRQRIQFKAPSPFAVFLTLFVIALIATAILVFALGFVLIALPVLAVLVGALVLWFYLRGVFRRLWPPAPPR